MADVQGSTSSSKADVVAATTAAWVAATSANTTISVATVGLATVILSLNPSGTTITAGTLVFEASDDGGTTWYEVSMQRVDIDIHETSYDATGRPTIKQVWRANIAGFTNFRVRLSVQITGTGTPTLNLRLQATAAPISNDPPRGIIKFVRVNATSDGDNTIISGVTGRKIRVISYALVANAAGTITLQDTTGTPVIAGSFAVAANGGVAFVGNSDSPAFETGVGLGVEINNSAGLDTLGHMAYQEV